MEGPRGQFCIDSVKERFSCRCRWNRQEQRVGFSDYLIGPRGLGSLSKFANPWERQACSANACDWRRAKIVGIYRLYRIFRDASRISRRGLSKRFSTMRNGESSLHLNRHARNLQAHWRSHLSKDCSSANAKPVSFCSQKGDFFRRIHLILQNQ